MMFFAVRRATILASACLLAGCGSNPAPQDKAKAAPQSRIVEGPIKGTAAKMLSVDPRIRKMRQIKENGITIWELAVVDDGVPQFDFADESCKVLHDNGVGAGNHVRIVDLALLQPNEPMQTSLGWVNCDNGMRLYL